MSPLPSGAFLHDVSHRSVSSRGRPGAARGFSRRNVAFQGAPDTRRRVQTPVRFGWPADAGPVTRAPRSGGATFREGGTHLDGRCRGMRRTMPRAGHTPCPGSPRAPSGPPGCSVSGVRLPLRRRLRQDGAPVRQPGRGEPHRRPRQPARQRHDPAPARTPVAGADVLHGPPRQRAVRLVVEPAPGHPRQVFPQHRAAGLAGPRRGPPRRPATAPAPARRDWPARAGCAGPGRTVPRPAAAHRSGRSPPSGPAPPRGGRAPVPWARLQAASPPPHRRPRGRHAPPAPPPPGPAWAPPPCPPPPPPSRRRPAPGGPGRHGSPPGAPAAAPRRRRSRSPGPGPEPGLRRIPGRHAARPQESRGRSRTGRSRRLSSRLPSSSATVGTRTGDIASRSPPSRARSARTVPRAPVRPVLPFPPRRTTPGPAGWRTTTPGSSPPGGAPAGSPRTPPRTPASRGHPRRRRRRPAPAPAKASRAARPPP